MLKLKVERIEVVPDTTTPEGKRSGLVTSEVTWDAGKLGGDANTISLLEIAAEHSSYVGPPGGPYISGKANILANGMAVYLLAKQEFDNVEVVEGELPPIPDVPEGAVS